MIMVVLRRDKPYTVDASGRPIFISRGYPGQYRLRLRRAIWFWRGLGERVWEVTFERGDRTSTAISCSFSWAVVCAIVGIYFERRR